MGSPFNLFAGGLAGVPSMLANNFQAPQDKLTPAGVMPEAAPVAPQAPQERAPHPGQQRITNGRAEYWNGREWAPTPGQVHRDRQAQGTPPPQGGQPPPPQGGPLPNLNQINFPPMPPAQAAPPGVQPWGPTTQMLTNNFAPNMMPLPPGTPQTKPQDTGVKPQAPAAPAFNYDEAKQKYGAAEAQRMQREGQ
jgi:hypothetical protein